VIDAVSDGDPARRDALTRLLADCDRAAPLLDRVAAERFQSLASDDPLLPDRIGDRYEVGREIGRGGMARVYLARDRKHGRDVAIKVLRPEVSFSLGRERFLLEIEIAARLRHPNIVPLYDSGDVAGALYFVMPFEEGPSLRDRLRDGRLPIAEAMSVLRDIARTLVYAHEHGVVHRDVKPDNVMLSGGAAVVTDFGIASAVSAAQTQHAMTQRPASSGSMVGTPAYMSPEQITGDPSADFRADIYSFGCLAYEVFAGSPPFADESVDRVIADQITTSPRPLPSLRPDVPTSVSELIDRALAKDPEARPQSARELLLVLEAPVPGTLTAARRVSRRARWAALATVVAVVGTAALWTTRTADVPEAITLAVLPFGNIGADSAMEGLAEALGDEVAGALARVPGVQVKSRSGARAYRGQLGVDVTAVGSRLKAAYVVTGVVRQADQHWILSADLARAADATSLWTQSFNLSLEQQAGAAEAIADTLTRALRGLFPRSVGAARALALHQQTSNPEAYRLYLRGQEKLDRRGQSVAESADLFRAAIRQDSLYARAHSGLSLALALFPTYQGIAPATIHDEVVHAAQRALDLDSTLAQPHIALGLVYEYDYQWDRAAGEFKRAIHLDGRNVEARLQYAWHLRNRGQLREALVQSQAARAEDPASAVVLAHLSYGYYLNRQVDSAMAESKRALETDSANRTTIWSGALVRLVARQPLEARALANRALSAFLIKDYVLARSGDTATARLHLRELDAERPQPWMSRTRRGLTYLGLGDTTQALSALELATEANEIWPFVFPVSDPLYDPIRGSARFRAMLRRVGLPDGT
jgi:serine/threonine-protein kinase